MEKPSGPTNSDRNRTLVYLNQKTIMKVTISVIIPVLNNAAGLKRTLEAISLQDIDDSKFEVIVVDNGSDDSPHEVAYRYGAIYLEEKDHLASPYSCRNRALEVAQGKNVVFLDSTCAPAKNWLREGFSLLNSGCDLVGGEVIFDVDERSSIGCLYDSLFNIQMEDSIKRRNVAKTTNLFVRRSVFDVMGMFPEGLRSGGDVRWTGEATANGFSLCFGERAVVVIEARGTLKLTGKQYRVSKGMPAVWKQQGNFFSGFVKKICFLWLPPNPILLWKRVDASGHDFIKRKFIHLFVLGYFLRVISGAGAISGCLELLSCWWEAREQRNSH